MAADVAEIEGVQPCETAVSGCGLAKRNWTNWHLEPPERAAGTGSDAHAIRRSFGIPGYGGEEGTEWVRNWVT